MTFLPPFYLDFTWKEIFFPEKEKACGKANASAHRQGKKIKLVFYAN